MTTRYFLLSLLLIFSPCIVALSREVVLPVPFIPQHKDTWILCIDGCSEEGPEAWDSPQLSGEFSEHGHNYCTFAALAMITRYFGGDLSQDRIAYQIYGGGGPEGDLGHGLGIPGRRVAELLQWALNTSAAPEVFNVSQDTAGFFDTFKTYIDQGRPFIFGVPGSIEGLFLLERQASHAIVVIGYNDDPQNPALIVHDPGFEPLDLFGVELSLGERARWSLQSLSTGEQVFWASCVIVPPEGPYSPRRDEYNLGRDLERSSGIIPGLDSDGDGIIDFDEVERFHTDPQNPDSDGDGITDFLEIREYVFNERGDYEPRDADCDQDGKRKELDINNDNDCYFDGEEDANHNGRRDLGESSNFEFDEECQWCGREEATVQVIVADNVIQDQYHGTVEIREVATDEGGKVLQGTATLEFSREYPSSFPGRITGITPAPPFVFKISGIQEETLEGRFLRFKRVFEGNPLAIVTLNIRGRSASAPDPGIIGTPLVFYAYPPQAMLTGSFPTFLQWVRGMEEIVLDPTTQEVWLKVPVAEDGLHAVLSKSRSFQETVRRGRNTVTVSMDVNFSLELERGKGGE